MMASDDDAKKQACFSISPAEEPVTSAAGGPVALSTADVTTTPSSPFSGTASFSTQGCADSVCSERNQEGGQPGGGKVVSDPSYIEKAGPTAANTALPSPTATCLDLSLACEQLRGDLIGRLDPLETPFGCRPLVYADWTASGRPVESIERFMRDVVLPTYGNTHNTLSETGRQTTALREEARQIIASGVNAKADGKFDEDVVLFVGSGTTAAITKLVSALSIGHKSTSWKASKRDTPVVFVGPFEHHSNILPWRESCADVVQIAESAEGGLDMEDLKRKLKAFSSRRLKIGSFTAASNLTGALEDTETITRVLHQGGALSFWDYATAAPYVKVDMNPDGLNALDKVLVAKDAVFMSGHKFLGGAGTPGLLVCKRRLFRNKTPVVPGGGTVLLVSDAGHTYLSKIEEREEGGTPDILGSIRLGLVFHMKEQLGSVEIREEEMTQLGLDALRSNPRIVLLGDVDRKRLPVFSFLVRHGKRFLHHNFVCALLNDLFGVQARAGCQCAGPYAIRLLGMPNNSVPGIKKHLVRGVGILKPGFCRLSLTFFMSDEEANYILDAVKFVADYGASFLPLYEPDVGSAEWKCISTPLRMPNSSSRKMLGEARYSFSGFGEDITYVGEEPVDDERKRSWAPVAGLMESEGQMYTRLFSEAFRLEEIARSTSSPFAPTSADALEGAARYPERPALRKDVEAIRWFYFPFEEASEQLHSGTGKSNPAPLVITPKVYPRGNPANEEALGSQKKERYTSWARLLRRQTKTKQ